MADRSEFIQIYRGAVSRFLKAIDEDMAGLEQEYDALAYSSVIVDADFPQEENPPLTAAEFKAAVISMQTLRNAFHIGAHDTNLYRLMDR